MNFSFRRSILAGGSDYFEALLARIGPFGRWDMCYRALRGEFFFLDNPSRSG